MKRIIIVIAFLFYVFKTFAQVDSNMHEENIKALRYSKGACVGEIQREKKMLVVFSFFNFLNDTLSLISDGRLVFKRAVSKDTNIVSSNYTGFSYAVLLPCKKSLLSIVSQKEHVKISVKVRSKYPIYTVSIYDGKWYVEPRKCFPKIK